jgi:hypothetical protein
MRAAHSPSPEARAWAKAVLGRAADGWMVSPLSARGGIALRVAEIVVPTVVARLEAVADAREAALGAADVERERAALAVELDAEGARVRAALRGER